MGRRTIAVTTGFLQLLYVGRLSHEQGLAVGGASRDSRHPKRLAVDWLSWPWRAGSRLVMRPSAVMPFSEGRRADARRVRRAVGQSVRARDGHGRVRSRRYRGPELAYESNIVGPLRYIRDVVTVSPRVDGLLYALKRPRLRRRSR